MSTHLDKVEEILTNSTPEILAIAKRKLNSGAIDVTQYDENSYKLAHILLISALQDTINQRNSGTYKKELKNLEHF